jgi:hypothetical protein
VFKRVHTEIIPDATLFRTVSYCRVGKRINFKPSIVTNIEIPPYRPALAYSMSLQKKGPIGLRNRSSD